MDGFIPTSLAGVKPQVKTLYYKGNIDPNIFDNCVAVVGSRRMTLYGERVLEKIIPPLVSAGVTIVSGYMYGVDKKAHELALECGGKSIAVLGWGIDWSNEIPAHNMLFMSEYEGTQKPLLWMFPKRNRIVAGLSQAVIVVEAAEKSGSLITADFAIKYNRTLFAVPGPITSSMSAGTNHLIKSRMAEMITSADNILERLQIQNLNIKNCKNQIQNSIIIKLLEEEPLSVDELSRKLKRSVENIGIELSSLMLAGSIFESNGKLYPK